MAGSGMEASKWGVFSTDVGQLVTAAVVGGTASELGGGKFANGAVTGAYTMLFNHMVHQEQEKKVGQVELEKAIEKAAQLEREKNLEYLEHFYDQDFDGSSQIMVQFPSQTKGGYYPDVKLFIGDKTLEADVLYRNYGKNIVTIIG